MKKLIFIFVGALFFRLALSFLVYHPDLNNHIDWGIRFWEYGPAKFFSPETNIWSYTWPNQPPGTIYLFAGIRKIFEFLFSVFSVAHFQLHVFPGSWLLFLEKSLYPALLKLPSILSDIGISILIYKFIAEITKSTKRAATGVVIWLVNPVIWYNSAVWGQSDAIINFLALLSFYFLFNKKLGWAVFAITFSFYIKASLLIFLPIFVIVAIKQNYDLKKWLLAIGISLLAIILFTIPFSHGNPLIWLIQLYQKKVFGEQLHLITANAFNIWATLAGIHERPDSLLLFGLAYRYWGYILFAVFYIPTLLIIYKKQNLKTLVWCLAIAAFSAFMLLTNMHERYLYPLFPYLTILVAVNYELLANYSAVSLINLFNLYNFWWVPFIPSLITVMSVENRLAPRILGGLNFIMFVFLYIRFLRLNPLKKIYSK